MELCPYRGWSWRHELLRRVLRLVYLPRSECDLSVRELDEYVAVVRSS